MQRFALMVVVMAVLAACAPDVPDSGRGVGFESYSDYVKRRDAAQPQPGRYAAGLPVSPERSATGAPARVAVAPGPTPLAASGVSVADRPRADTFAGIAPSSPQPSGGAARISDEQDFDAVAARESIESDRERLQRQRDQLVVFQPTAVPQRTDASPPNIVEFALATRHNPGQQLYQRNRLFAPNYERACAPFTSADLAQEAFLAAGGPERDRLGLDPDGDGFACGWDPRPFRVALR